MPYIPLPNLSSDILARQWDAAQATVLNLEPSQIALAKHFFYLGAFVTSCALNDVAGDIVQEADAYLTDELKGNP